MRWIPFFVLASLVACGGSGPNNAEPYSTVDEAPQMNFAAVDAVTVPTVVLARSGPSTTGHPNAILDIATTVVFVNFDGETITSGPASDALTNTSFIGDGGTVPAFSGTAAQRAQIIAEVELLFDAYNIEFVVDRPSSGSYAMVMVGGTADDIGFDAVYNVVGVAPMDCDNRLPRDIAYVFSARLMEIVSEELQVRSIAESIAHELGHTLGLPHTTAACDIMSYGWCPAGKTFTNDLIELADTTSCDIDEINPHDHLTSILGPDASTTPPPPAAPPSPTPPPTAPPSWGSCESGGQTGVCQQTSQSCDGTYQSGLCPGPADIRCCLSWGSCVADGAQGVCQQTSASCNGSYLSGLCPGPSDVRCCLPGS